MADEPLVSAEEVASVLSGNDETNIDRQAPLDPSGDPSGDGTRVYSLRRPVAISTDAEAAARVRIEELAAALAKTLATELEAEVTFSVSGFQQQSASAVLDSIADPTWVLSFDKAKSGGVALVLDPACALSLVEIALGGLGASQAPGRQPTALEMRVMRNLGAALVRQLAERTGMPLVAASFGVGSLPQKLAAPGEVVGAAIVEIHFGSAQRTAMLLCTADLLRPTSNALPSGARRIGPLAPRLERLRVEARPVLDAGLVSLDDLLRLEPGSVLRLEAPAGRPFELRVGGQSLFGGRIARSAGDGDDPGRANFTVRKRRGRAAGERSKNKKTQGGGPGAGAAASNRPKQRPGRTEESP